MYVVVLAKVLSRCKSSLHCNPGLWGSLVAARPLPYQSTVMSISSQHNEVKHHQGVPGSNEQYPVDPAPLPFDNDSCMLQYA